jgi:hypothetical protein
MCEITMGDTADSIGFNELSSGELICDSCLKLIRGWKSKTDVMFLVSDNLPEDVMQAMNDAIPELSKTLNAELDAADVDFQLEFGEARRQNATTSADGETID